MNVRRLRFELSELDDQDSEVICIESRGSDWVIQTATERVLLRGSSGKAWARALDEFERGLG